MKSLLETDQISPDSFFKDIFENIPAATAILSGDGRILGLNLAFKNLFQPSDDSSQPPSSFEDISSSFWKKQDLQEFIHHIIDSKIELAEQTFDWQHEDGSLRYIALNSKLLSSHQSYFILTFCDMTAAKQVEKEHSERIRHMMHELRNPLSNISLCVELLADSTKENNQEDTDMFLTKASNSVQRMKQVINDLSTTRKAS